MPIADEFKKKMYTRSISGYALIEFLKLLRIARKPQQVNPSPIDIVYELRELNLENIDEAIADLEAFLIAEGQNPEKI